MNQKERKVNRQLMAEDVATGLSVDEVALKFHVTQDTVKRACGEHGILLSVKPTLDAAIPLNLKILAALYQASTPIPEIQHTLYASVPIISQVYHHALKLELPHFPTRQVDSKGYLLPYPFPE
jgi:hypothetical protein